MTMEIDVGGGLFAIVDDDDFHRLALHKWHHKKRNCNLVYAYTNLAKSTNWRDGFVYTSMHRFIMQPHSSLVIDHVDGNGLNNTKANLRICSQLENTWNSRQKPGASVYKGVSFRSCHGKQWRAQIRVLGRRVHLGYFPSESEASEAYRAAANKYFGQFAKT